MRGGKGVGRRWKCEGRKGCREVEMLGEESVRRWECEEGKDVRRERGGKGGPVNTAKFHHRTTHTDLGVVVVMC